MNDGLSEIAFEEDRADVGKPTVSGSGSRLRDLNPSVRPSFAYALALADEESRLADPMLAVAPIESRLAQDTVVREHYLHRRTSVSYAYGLFDDDELVGVVTFGTPPSRHLQISACRTRPELVVELNRLWVHDRMPRNTESWFIARALKLLPPLIVVSYADTKYGHFGHMYRAANFHYAGYTDMERKTPRYDYIPWVEGKHTRDAFRNGYSKRVRRMPKAKYWLTTGDRRDRKRLMAIATWPLLDWHEVPTPGEVPNTTQIGIEEVA